MMYHAQDRPLAPPRRGEHTGALARRWTSTRSLRALIGLGILVSGSGIAGGQEELPNYRKPILMVETGGHHARVRSILWHDDSTLLTAGEDKVVKAWDVRDEGRLIRSIRPPIWRGAAGTIYAMAESRPDARGRSFLAVGGYGVEGRRGDITVYRFPELDPAPGREVRIPTGDVAARLLPPPENAPPGQLGHVNSVLCMAFDPTGRWLASGSRDRTVILWELPGFIPRRVLRNHTGDVRAVAFNPDGTRLASTGGDGSIRLWDVARGVQLDQRAGNVAMNAMAYSPDGRWIYVGRENGDLFRLDTQGLATIAPVQFPTLPTQGPVETMAISTDGSRLAVGIKNGREDNINPLTFSSDVEIRALPDGQVIRRDPVPGLVQACAFNRLGNRLAYAGGHAQSIFIRDLTNPDNSPMELRGQGSTPYLLGFTEDSQTVGFMRMDGNAANPAEPFEAFDFGRRKARRVARNLLRGGIGSIGGWGLVGSINRYRLEAVNQDGRRWTFDLNRDTERNWWSYTMIPQSPAQGHPRATVAIGTEAGVAIFDLETGRRTRVFTGQSGPVVSVVPSPDGRWLATGSLDQTIMIYPLAGCDTRPGLGATFRRRPDGAWAVAEVEPRGFAAGMGLVPGDVVTRAAFARGAEPPTVFDTPERIAQFVAEVDQQPPYLIVSAVQVRRAVFLPPPFGLIPMATPWIGATKRNGPLMTLLLGTDGEWVVWTPQGYYDTSIAGDSLYLGWHRNSDYRSTRPTDFFPVGAYAGTMYQPRILERLWQTGNLDQAMALPGLPAVAPTVVVAEKPVPRIVFTSVEGGTSLSPAGTLWAVDIANPRLGMNIVATDTSKLVSRRVIADEQVLNLAPLAAPTASFSEQLAVQLVPKRRTRLVVEAVNENGNKRSDWIDMLYLPPRDEPVPEGKLLVLGIGNELSRNPSLLPPIPFADKDAERLADILARHLVTADGKKPSLDRQNDRNVLTGEKASAESIRASLDDLARRIDAQKLRKGDIVALVINSHVLQLQPEKDSVIATADTDPAAVPRPEPTIAVRDVSDLLGRVADYGCRVVVFLDGVHQLPEKGFESTIKPWVRDLHRNRRVIAFIASKEGPSLTGGRAEQGLFTLGVANAFLAAGRAAYTLEAFRRQLRKEVLDLSERGQWTDAFIPIEIPLRTPFGQP